MLDRFKKNKKILLKNTYIVSQQTDSRKEWVDLIEAYKEYKLMVTNSKVIENWWNRKSRSKKSRNYNNSGIEYLVD
jgi:hypothetical protein